MRYKKLFSYILSIIIVLSTIVLPVMAEENTILENDEYGYFEMPEYTKEERDEFNASISEIKNVKINEFAVQRNKDSNGILPIYNDTGAVPFGDEIVTYDENAIEVYSDNSNKVSLAAAVDNSENACFPPIGNQVGGACAAWSTIYYQLTNNINLIRKKAAKKTVNGVITPIYENIMAPRWIYNLATSISENEDGTYSQSGIWFRNSYSAARNFGCPSWADCDANLNTSTSYSWNPGVEQWKNAMQNKIDNIMFLSLNKENADSIISPNFTNSSVNEMKKLLMDGYVLSYYTFVYSYKYQNNDNIHVTECVRKFDNLTGTYTAQGAHAMTIVGYDDNMWIDVNEDGIEDEAEHGALKVANSWGTGYHDKGFIWIAYDALNKKSNILDDDPYRIPIIYFQEVYHIQPKVSYTPLVVAEVNLDTNCRNQLAIEIGISDTTQSTPSISKGVTESEIHFLNNNDETNKPFNMAFYYSEDTVNLGFNGNEGYGNADFTFDMTPLLCEIDFRPDKAYQFYVSVKDSKKDDNINSLNSFRLVNNITNEIIDSDNTVISADGNTVTSTVSGAINDTKVFDSTQEINAKFNNMIQESSINSSNIYITDENGILENLVANGKNNYTDISFNQHSDKKSLTIMPPSNGFIDGIEYNLHFNKNILTYGGNSFNGEKVLRFYVLK